MHKSVEFWKSGLTPKMDRMVGFSTLNVLLFNGLTTDGKDAVLNEYLKMDECLTETEGKNKIMHSHTISPCASPTASTLVSTTNKPNVCSRDYCVKDFRWQNVDWNATTGGTYGGVYGLALDGHVIYGPYNKAGELWSCEDLDVCNGFWLDDRSYGYASTTFYPYLVGCWGPGPLTRAHIPGCSPTACGDSAVSLTI
jgi:hypothetical protein